MRFSRQIKKFNESAERKTLLVFKIAGTEMFSQIVSRTPVDTGRLRGNWQTSIASMPKSILKRTDKNEGKAENAAALRISKLSLGRTLYIANNLPYAQRIEDGYSKQAPLGMVKVPVLEWDTMVRKAVRAVK